MSDPDELGAREAARAKRRDRDMDAPTRSGMRSGLSKGFKQILDAQVRRGRAAGDSLDDSRARDATRGPRRGV